MQKSTERKAIERAKLHALDDNFVALRWDIGDHWQAAVHGLYLRSLRAVRSERTCQN